MTQESGKERNPGKEKKKKHLFIFTLCKNISEFKSALKER